MPMRQSAVLELLAIGRRNRLPHFCVPSMFDSSRVKVPLTT
jgi:hypothetical protein